MVRKYFGTDGIRGRANSVIVPELALRIGQAAGLTFRRGDHRHRVVIGKDTRLSGYMIEQALTAGFLSVGMDVMLLGPLPTPAIGFLTRSMRADLGVMIFFQDMQQPRHCLFGGRTQFRQRCRRSTPNGWCFTWIQSAEECVEHCGSRHAEPAQGSRGKKADFAILVADGAHDIGRSRRGDRSETREGGQG